MIDGAPTQLTMITQQTPSAGPIFEGQKHHSVIIHTVVPINSNNIQVVSKPALTQSLVVTASSRMYSSAVSPSAAGFSLIVPPVLWVTGAAM